MFARANFVQNSLSKVQGEKEKTDEELLQEAAEESNKKQQSVEEEFGSSGAMYWYGRLAQKCRLFTGDGPYEGHFTFGVILAIVLAGVLVGIDTYDNLRDMEIWSILENIVLGIFVAECVIKIIAEGKDPLNFFVGEEGRYSSRITLHPSPNPLHSCLVYFL